MNTNDKKTISASKYFLLSMEAFDEMYFYSVSFLRHRLLPFFEYQLGERASSRLGGGKIKEEMGN